jgi:glycosyltransferase involved in cell wall biosynthesis
VERVVLDARYVRRRPSGIGAYVEELASRMPRLAPEQRFHLWCHPERPQPVRADNVSTVTVRATADGLFTLLAPSLLDELRRDDVVHFPTSLLGRGVRCASVVTVHDLMWVEHPRWVDGRRFLRRLRQPYYQLGMRWALRHATRLIAVSKATADRIAAVDRAAARRVVVTYNAARADFVPSADPERARADAARIVGRSEPYFLVVGKNEPYKAHHLALAAFARAAKRDELLVLVQRTQPGRGLDATVRELGLASRAVWLPSVSRAELVTLLQGARALIQPSLAEGFGLPVLEAIACGCPVVASDTPALVEVLGGAAVHAPVGSAGGLADALRRIHDEVFRAELVARGLERARDFDWDATAKATLEVYREAAATGPRPAGGT